MMPIGLADLSESERGVWAIGTLLIATALLFLGKITSDQWVDIVKLLTGILIISKTVTTAIDQRNQAPKAAESK